jgi:hypothetical protein
MRTSWVSALCAMLLVASAGRASAQNLFEVQVFPDEILKPGETEVEFHSVAMPSHLHASFELSHGWNSRFETGAFLETSPSIDDDHAAFTGFHFRPKFRFAEWRRFPFHVSVSAEYAFVKHPGDLDFRQALALTPILERHLGSFELSLNPSFEFALKGPEAGESPVFEPSAKLASRVSKAVWVGVEYYAETGPIKHFEPLAEQHHLVFPTVDVHSGSGWDLNVGVGRGLTGASEHWVLKMIVGRSL